MTTRRLRSKSELSGQGDEDERIRAVREGSIESRNQEPRKWVTG